MKASVLCWLCVCLLLNVYDAETKKTKVRKLKQEIQAADSEITTQALTQTPISGMEQDRVIKHHYILLTIITTCRNVTDVALFVICKPHCRCIWYIVIAYK